MTSARKVVLKVQVPVELNTLDMGPDGKRSGPMSNYGNPYYQGGVPCIRDVFEAWQVVEYHCTNEVAPGRWPEVSDHGGPGFVLKFRDGVWREASFRGLGGAPWLHCDFEGVAAETGALAWLKLQLKAAENAALAAEAVLTRQRRRCFELQQALATAAARLNPGGTP